MSIPIFEKIERIRAAEGLTQAEFSERIGVSANTLNAMKSRGSSPRFEVVEKILIAWPKYALWLTTEEVDIGAGQIAPNSGIADESYLVRYRIIDNADARYMDKCIIKETALQKLVFIQNRQDTSDLAALLIVNQAVFYQISLTPNFKNAVWISAGNMNFDSDHGGMNVLNEFRAWLTKVNQDLINTAEFWEMDGRLLDDVYKVLIIPVSALHKPKKDSRNFERFNAWKEGKMPYVN